MTEDTDSEIEPQVRTRYSLLPLRDVVVFPHMVIPLFVGREKSIRALEAAMEAGKRVFLAAQHDATDDDPSAEKIFKVGTVANILQLLKLPDGTLKVLVEGISRAMIVSYVDSDDMFRVDTQPIVSDEVDDKESEVLIRTVMEQFEKYVKVSSKIPQEILTSLASVNEPGRLADSIAGHLNLRNEEKQKVLEISDDRERLEYLLGIVESEVDLLQVEKRIRGRVKKQMEKSQREYYLNEQMKAIQNELGEMDETPNELEELQKKIDEAGMPKDAQEKAESELKKLRMMAPMAAEATVVRNYIDWLIQVPWKKKTRISKDLAKAEEILENDHYGLAKVKERILEYLAVQQRINKAKGPILCLVGPPGVGKTSLGESIARATNRKFLRMSLGGVRDEAEIRGHRRTYIGSLPGKIIQNLAKAKSRNPLFMLDEVDKMSMDFRGDPSSALLEVLDPEQNHSFGDHYLEVDYDLSEVMFIATANTLNIPAPLLDRMEIIRISGYTEEEKINIATRYLVPKQVNNNGLKSSEISIAKSALKDIVRYYTREAGVRNLEREVAKICRKVTKHLLLTKTKDLVSISSRGLDKYLGVRRHRYGKAEENNRVGQVTGLAWTEVGGELLTIEAAVMPGKGNHIYTGKLGEVMQESIQAAMSVVRTRGQRYGIDTDFFQKQDVHIHVPEGATPKDGPSAGVSMCTAMFSAITEIPVLSQVAMTGEITLRGEVLPIGGLKEKLLAAQRGGLKTVLIPKENEKELIEVPKNIKRGLDIVAVRWIDEIFALALENVPMSDGVKSEESISAKSKSQASSTDETDDYARTH